MASVVIQDAKLVRTPIQKSVLNVLIHMMTRLVLNVVKTNILIFKRINAILALISASPV